jgi:hypothetical protein
MMRTALVVLATSIALLWGYNHILLWSVGYAVALPQPSQWGGFFPTHLSAVLTWMQVIHTVAILAVSIPFAFLISYSYGRRGVWVALGITAALFALFTLPGLVRFFAIMSPHVRIIMVVDNLKLLLILPMLVLLMDSLIGRFRAAPQLHC